MHAFRVDDYAAYYRLVKHLLGQCLPVVGNAGEPVHSGPVHQALADAHYPEPTEQCDYCRWADRCGSAMGERACQRIDSIDPGRVTGQRGAAGLAIGDPKRQIEPRRRQHPSQPLRPFDQRHAIGQRLLQA